MSDNGYSIEVDDLILFFRGKNEDDQETIVNRLIPHSTYTNEKRRLAADQIQPGWQDTVLADPPVPRQDNQHYYVANLARLVPPEENRKPAAASAAVGGPFTAAPGDLFVFPPEDPKSCYRVPREVYEKCQENCREIPARDIPDLEFMVREEGVVLANVPKVTPTGCTCIPLSLVSLRSGMLKGHPNKTEHARHMHEPLARGHKR